MDGILIWNTIPEVYPAFPDNSSKAKVVTSVLFNPSSGHQLLQVWHPTFAVMHKSMLFLAGPSITLPYQTFHFLFCNGEVGCTFARRWFFPCSIISISVWVGATKSVEIFNVILRQESIMKRSFHPSVGWSITIYGNIFQAFQFKAICFTWSGSLFSKRYWRLSILVVGFVTGSET